MTDTESAEAAERLDFDYESDAGNARVHRTWLLLADEQTVRETDGEMMYNYVTERWELVAQFTRDYPLAADGTLAGDGSNWAGTGREWREWAEERHYKRLALRFPNDEITDGYDHEADEDPPKMRRLRVRREPAETDEAGR